MKNLWPAGELDLDPLIVLVDGLEVPATLVVLVLGGRAGGSVKPETETLLSEVEAGDGERLAIARARPRCFAVSFEPIWPELLVLNT